MSRPTSHSGFTLVELLVVIGVIAVLASIVGVSVGKVHETARRTQCAANLRQIGVLLQLYTQDNKGRLPGPLWTTFGPYPDQRDPMLLGYKLQSYMTNLDQLNGNRPHVELFECPAWAEVVPADKHLNGRCYVLGRNAKRTDGVTVLPFGYPELNGRAGTGPLMLAEMDNPAMTVAITDLDAVNGGASYANRPDVPADPVHGNVRNVLYFDGRVTPALVP